MSDAPSGHPPAPLEADPALMLQALARRMATRTVDDVAAAVGAPVRESDGYVFQHLLPGPLTIGELARRLGITQQGASKAVSDMERRGLVIRDADPDDRRVRQVSLTSTALDAVVAARRTRADIAELVEETLGPRRAASFRRALVELLAATGAADDLRDRSVPAPD